MTRLGERLKAEIAREGPISIGSFFAICLLDPQDGYYTTREPFGAAGDFTTAPEVSQMFGELVGVWLRAAWDACGRPESAVLAEPGPGRGTLMKDVVRTLARLGCAQLTAEVLLVEASPRLAQAQKETLGGSPARFEWISGFDNLPSKPLFLFANEFLDALPVRQYQKAGGSWRERMIGLDTESRLALMLGPGAPDFSLLPPGAGTEPEGAVVELAPAREAVMDQICAHLAAHGGTALMIDYGHLRRGFGDTLQAMRRHAFEGILENPGEADLTAHVDFAALAALAARHGLAAWTATQSDFLLRLGLLERAGSLGAGADEAQQEKLRGEVERLAGPDAMGTLFKVLAVAPSGVALPALTPAPAALQHGCGADVSQRHAASGTSGQEKAHESGAASPADRNAARFGTGRNATEWGKA